MDKITVCIPTYQSAATLQRAIESVLLQRDCEVEIIVGDNASTDDTHAMVSAIASQRISYFRHASNIGYPANVNSCLERANADYIFILCADDFLIHELVLAELLAELKGGDFIAAHVPFRIYQQRAGECAPSGPSFSPLPAGRCTPDVVFSAFTTGRGCFGWGWLFRRSVIADGGLRFETDHDMAPDTMFWLCLCMMGAVAEARSRAPGYAFVMHENSLGGRIFQERALEVYEQLVTFERRLFQRLGVALPEVARSVAHRQFRYSASEFSGLTQKAFSEGRISRVSALGLLSYALRAHPRAALTPRFLRNLVFILLPRAVRARVLAARLARHTNSAAAQ